MSNVRIKPELLHVLKHLRQESFTVAQLTQAYLNNPKCQHFSKKAARQYVYRNMVRMMNEGLMERRSSDEGWPHYRLRSKFKQMKEVSDENRDTPGQQPNLIACKPVDINTSSANILKERLSKHRSEMLCAMGEAEEYSELCNEYPELCEEAQGLYNDARERSAMLLGS